MWNIRNLDCGELRNLRENPDDEDDDLYSKSRPRMHAARGVAMKIADGKNRNITLPPPEKKPSSAGPAGALSNAGPSRTHGSTACKGTGDRPTSADRRENASFASKRASNSTASMAAKQRRRKEAAGRVRRNEGRGVVVVGVGRRLQQLQRCRAGGCAHGEE